MALNILAALLPLALSAEAASTAEWEEALSNRPNASNTITVPGYNISNVYPGSSVAWTLEISVVGTIMVEDVNDFEEGIVSYETISDVEYYDARRLRLVPPKEIEFDPERWSEPPRYAAPSQKTAGANNSWIVCQSWFSFIPESNVDEVDPSCEGTLPAECIDELRSFVGSDNVCEIPEDLTDLPCSGHWRTSEHHSLSGNDTSVDLTVVHAYSPDKQNKPIAFYDASIASIYTGVFSWRSFADQSNASRTETPGSFACIRATNFSDGSRTRDEPISPQFGAEDEDDDEGVAGRQSAGLRNGLVIAVIITAVAWVI